MKYYIDSSAAINLVENGISEYKHFKNTFVPKLLIDEWTKNLEKHYPRQRNQILYLKKNHFSIDWRFCETLLFLQPFDFPAEYGINAPKICYDSIIKYENYSDFTKDGKPEDIMHSAIIESMEKMREGFQKYYFNEIFFDLKYLKKTFNINKPYLVRNLLLENYLNTGIKILEDKNIINSKKEKEIYIKRGMKSYFKKNNILDYYINVTIEKIKDDNNELVRNDASDLFYLLYLDRKNGDIIVTDDKDLRRNCNNVEQGSAISLTEYLKL